MQAAVDAAHGVVHEPHGAVHEPGRDEADPEPITEPLPALQAALAAHERVQATAEEQDEEQEQEIASDTDLLPRLRISAASIDVTSTADRDVARRRRNGIAVKPKRHVQPKRPAEPDRPAQPKRPAEPDRPAQPKRSVQSDRPVQPRPAQPDREFRWGNGVGPPGKALPVPARTKSAAYRMVPAAQQLPRSGKAGTGWRVRMAGVAGLAVVLVVAASVAIALSSHSAAPSGRSKPRNPEQARQARMIRNLAAAWVTQQVSHDAVVSCDPTMCAAVRAHGFPASYLQVIQPTSGSPPLKSAVVIVTPELGTQLGQSLDFAWAPTLLRSFGSGTERIQIRVIAPYGEAAYKSALAADLKQRITVGAQLAAIRQITESGTARRQLVTGQVDSRLLEAIVVLATQQPIDVIAFGGSYTEGTPLRVAYLAETDPAAKMGRSAYVRAAVAVLNAQPASDRPAHAGAVPFDGQTVLQIEFGAPSPLGVFNPASP